MTEIKLIEGGVCAAQGFTGAGIHCGSPQKPHEAGPGAHPTAPSPPAAAAVYTTNLVKGAPLEVTKKHLANGLAQRRHLQQRQRQHLQRRRRRDRRGDLRAAGRRARHRAGGRRRRLHGRHRPDAEPGAHSRPACPSSCKALGPNSHDVGEAIMTTDTQLEGDRRRVHGGRQDLPPGRHRQGQRHDPPEHGDHARLPDDGLRRLARRCSKRPSPRTCRRPSTWSAWTGTPRLTTWSPSSPTAWRATPRSAAEGEDFDDLHAARSTPSPSTCAAASPATARARRSCWSAA